MMRAARMDSRHLMDASRMASARQWVSHAYILRDAANTAHLTANQRAMLLRDAQAADRRATWCLRRR
jgi:hypothetical protein